MPLNWWERDVAFFVEIFDNVNVKAVVDVMGSSNMAIACLMSEPPRPYVALLRNDKHVEVIRRAVDKHIMREMGREGPPPSKFYEKEMKDLVGRMFPQQDASDAEDSEGQEDDDSESSEG